MGACCFCACIFKIVLGVLNMILLVAGLLTCGVGGILIGMSDSPVVLEMIRVIAVPILEFQVGKGYLVASVTGDFKEFITPVAWFLIVMGAIIAILAVVGYVGLTMNMNVFLYIYVSFIGASLVIQIVVAIVFYSGGLTTPINAALRKTIVESYQGMEDLGNKANTTASIYAFAWNIVMLKFNCCGAANYEDFYQELKASEKWPRSKEVVIVIPADPTSTDPRPEKIQFSGTLDMPIVCCKNQGEFPTLKYRETSCVQRDSPYNNQNSGCTVAIMKELEKTKRDTLSMFIFAVILQIALIIMVNIIINENKVFGK